MRKLTYLFAGWLMLTGLAVAQPTVHLKGLNRGLGGTPVAPEAPLRRRMLGRSHVLVQFDANPTDGQVNDLQNLGATVLSYVPDFALSISVKDGTSFDGIGALAVGRLLPVEKISPDLAGTLVAGATVTVLAEFYQDVDPNDARAVAKDAGLLIQENPDLLSNHLLVSGTAKEVQALAGWDDVAYIFPAAKELIAGTPMHASAAALTKRGAVAQSVALVGGWDGAVRGGADLKYTWVQLTDKLPADSVHSEIVRAFSEWAKYAKLTFTPTSDANGNQTIAVLFASGDHGDGYPFVPQGGILAHTFYPFPINPEPIAGNMHFNTDESWKIGANLDLFSIALHEAGHALGLGHSDQPGAVMYPYYHQATGLAQDDINAILQLYARQDTQPDPSTPAPATPPASPLTLTVQPPASPTTASSVAISGSTSGGSGTVQVGWTANNGFSGTAQGSAAWTVSAVPLNIGDTVVTNTARDSGQSLVTRSLAITRNQLPAPIPTPTPAPPTPGPDTTPPSMTILSPANTNVSTSDSSMVVQGTAQDNVGVALVTWSSSNGVSGTASGTNNWITPAIPLYVGATTITIRASDAAGNTSWRSISVTRN
ncbi:MAG TPA: matrixin family metalloprotease [Bryobacteraceae bacterium]|nr:matrixin family metalloprotease [Bryobacteraceae bacterium]